MNLRNCFAAALALLCLSVNAQVKSTETKTEIPRTVVRLSIAANRSNISGYNLLSLRNYPQPLWSGAVAVGLERHIRGDFSLRTDLQYAARGYTSSDTSRYSTTGYRIHYVDLIPQLAYRANENLSLAFGPYIGRRFYEQIRVGQGGNWQKFDNSFVELSDEFDAGLTSSLTFHVKRFSAFVRYQFGLHPLSEIMYTDEYGADLGTSKLRNRAWQFGLSYELFSKTTK
jgi:hypothetical protein